MFSTELLGAWLLYYLHYVFSATYMMIILSIKLLSIYLLEFLLGTGLHFSFGHRYSQIYLAGYGQVGLLRMMDPFLYLSGMLSMKSSILLLQVLESWIEMFFPKVE